MPFAVKLRPPLPPALESINGFADTVPSNTRPHPSNPSIVFARQTNDHKPDKSLSADPSFYAFAPSPSLRKIRPPHPSEESPDRIERNFLIPHP